MPTRWLLPSLRQAQQTHRGTTSPTQREHPQWGCLVRYRRSNLRLNSRVSICNNTKPITKSGMVSQVTLRHLCQDSNNSHHHYHSSSSSRSLLRLQISKRQQPAFMYVAHHKRYGSHCMVLYGGLFKSPIVWAAPAEAPEQSILPSLLRAAQRLFG